MRRSLFWLLDHHPETRASLRDLHHATLARATLAEELGFEALWLAEHHFFRVGTVPNPAVLLAAIASRTQRLRLGPATAVLPLRHPVQVAEDYALVDLISDGRLNMGVGSGSQPSEFAPFGVDFEERASIFAERLSLLKARWEAAVRVEIEAASLNVAPVQEPWPPLHVATTQEVRAREIGAAGDALLTLASPGAESLEGVKACVRAHAEGFASSAEANGPPEAVVMMLAHVADNEAEVRAVVVPALGRLMQVMTGAAFPDAEGLYHRLRTSGVGLFGTPEEIDERLTAMEADGLRHLAFISPFGGMSEDVARNSLRFLAPQGP